MRILTILTIPFTFNGISNVALNYYNNLENENIVMDFAFPENSNNQRISDQINEKESIVYLLPSRTKELLKYRKQLLKIFTSTQYDAVHIHGNSSTMLIETTLAKKCNVRGIITHAHNTFSKYPKIDAILSGYFLNSYTYPLACGIDAGNFLYKGQEFTVLENGIKVDDYEYRETFRNQIRASLNLKDHDLLIGHIGHFTFQKNQEYLVDLMKRNNFKNKNVKLLLVGDGENRQSLEESVKKLNLEDKILFFGNRSDVNEIYSALDILIMPSRYEGLPLTLVEAQASDLKCFVSNKVTNEVNQSGTIDYFDIDEFENLEEKIEKYISEPINREEKKNFEIIKSSKYNIKNSVNKLEKIYEVYGR